MQVAVGAGDDQFGCGQAAELRGNGRRVLVPLTGVADEGEIGGDVLAMLGEEPRQRG